MGEEMRTMGKDGKIKSFEELTRKELAQAIKELVKQGYAKIDAEAQNHLSKTGYPNRIVLSVGTPKGKSK